MNLTEHLSTRLLSNNDIQRSHDTAVICGLDLYWHGLNSRDAKGHRMVNEDQVQGQLLCFIGFKTLLIKTAHRVKSIPKFCVVCFG